ncbi:MAG: PAS domain S-box protein [Fimbriimonadales bacterium]|nr:PAS domain S-box protein [Fimbriimonadales bacterium]
MAEDRQRADDSRRDWIVSGLYALGFFVVSATYIVLSDSLLAKITSSLPEFMRGQTTKGLAFIGLMSILLWVVLFGFRKSLRKEERRRHAAEQTVYQTLESLRAVVDSSPLAIIGVDLDGNVNLWSYGAERIFGWKSEEAVGYPVPFIPGDAVESFRSNLERVKRGEAIKNLDLVRVRSDGTPIQIRLSAAPVRSSDGTITSIMAVIEDVTEQNALEARMRQSERLEGIGRLSGGIAHDFNNLLSAIIGYGELALSNLPDGHISREYIQKQEAAANKAANLVSQLLAFARERDGEPEVVDVNQLLNNLQDMLVRVLPENVRLEMRLAEDAPLVKIDPGRLEQVIMNLCVNAGDAMPHGGKLTIATERVVMDETDQPSGVCLALTAADTGIGMNEEVISRLFEPFFTTKPAGRGTGLGLPTAHGIVSAAGGDIRAEGKLGEGSKFTVLLPEYKEQRSEQQDQHRQATFSGALTILVVEDEEVVRSMMLEVLQSLGHTAIECASGEEAIRAVEAGTRVDLLLTDMMMPGISGRDLVLKVRSVNPDLPVVVASGYGTDLAENVFDENEHVQFLSKPFTPAELSDAIESALRTLNKKR